MCERTGIFGSCLRSILVIFNILLFIIGCGVFSAAAIIRWNPDLIIDKISDESVESLLNFSALDLVSMGLLSIGSFLMLLSIIGLLGSLCANKCFLILYQILIILIFVCHGVLLLLVSFKSSDIEDEFRKELNKTMSAINYNNTTATKFTEKCAEMKALSTVFECCGINGPSDFLNQTFVNDCCANKTTDGCAQKTIDTLTNSGVNIVLIPNGILLGIELILIILVPFLISQIKRRKRRESDRQINYLRPTTEFRKSYGSTLNNY